MNIPEHPTAIQLLKLLTFDKLHEVALETKADFKAKKLPAMRMMCMMTCAFLETTRLSQRFIGREWANHSFASLFGLSPQDGKVRHSSISHRILLITNNFTASALEICGYYRHRWDIEVFYKFLKQNLSMSHLISSSENGLSIILYMMLIVATLVMIFEKLNSMGPAEAIQTMKIQLMN